LVSSAHETLDLSAHAKGHLRAKACIIY